MKADSVGAQTETFRYTYNWKDVALYALGVGATAEELDYLFEKRGPKVIPSFAVVPGYAALDSLFALVDGNLLGLVHASQRFTFQRTFEPEDTVLTQGRVEAVYDLKRMAQAVFVTETRRQDGTPICRGEWTMLYRLDGNFGGEKPPASAKSRVTYPDRAPDAEAVRKTQPEQALLYRLLGDSNPLHADPELAKEAGFDKPILHGLCTYGIVCRDFIKTVCDDDPSRLESLGGQFRKPVFPGDSLKTEAWNTDGNQYAVRGVVPERDSEIVFTNAEATTR